MHIFIIKISSKWRLQQVVCNHSWDIDFKDLINLYKKCVAKRYSALVIDYLNHLNFRRNLLKRIQKLIMTTDDKFRDENL